MGDRAIAAATRVRALAAAFLHGPDLVLALLILAGCAGSYFLTTRFEEVSMLLGQNVPPEFFPRLLIGSIAVLAVLLPFEHRFHKQGKAHLDEDRRQRVKPISIATASLLCLIVALMPWLGTFLSMVVACALLPPLWGERRLKVVLPFAILFPGAVTLLFTQALKVHFEPGILEVVLR